MNIKKLIVVILILMGSYNCCDKKKSESVGKFKITSIDVLDSENNPYRIDSPNDLFYLVELELVNEGKMEFQVLTSHFELPNSSSFWKKEYEIAHSNYDFFRNPENYDVLYFKPGDTLHIDLGFVGIESIDSVLFRPELINMGKRYKLEYLLVKDHGRINFKTRDSVSLAYYLDTIDKYDDPKFNF